jgi:tryptophanyl-tRNA synthetase
MATFKPLVFSGMQPTHTLHIGNYLGALSRWVDMQATHDCIYCVVDMHAITVPQDPADLQKAIREVTAAYIAAGIDPKRSIIFNQSQVTEHAELAWVFNCIARLGWLNRMTQFKEKAGKDRENASIGLYAYPALMAADILAYRATHVPVGEDQKQHLELARDIAKKFNVDFAKRIVDLGYNVDSEGLGAGWDQSGLEHLPYDTSPAFFPLPEPLTQGPAPRVMSLRDGLKKMSKSDPSDLSRINLTDDADAISNKIRRAKTDPEPLPSEVAGLKDRPEALNLVTIYAALSNQTVDSVLSEFGGGQFSSFKQALGDAAVARLAPIAGEMRKLLADLTHIDAILADGSNRARAIAKPNMDAVKDIVGFIRAK